MSSSSAVTFSTQLLAQYAPTQQERMSQLFVNNPETFQSFKELVFPYIDEPLVLTTVLKMAYTIVQLPFDRMSQEALLASYVATDRLLYKEHNELQALREKSIQLAQDEAQRKIEIALRNEEIIANNIAHEALINSEVFNIVDTQQATVDLIQDGIKKDRQETSATKQQAEIQEEANAQLQAQLDAVRAANQNLARQLG